MLGLKKKSSNTSNPYYESIHDCPIYVWHQITKDDDLSLLRKENLYKKKSEIVSDNGDEVGEVFFSLLSEYFEEFGLSKFFQKEIEKKIEIINLNLEFVETGDRFILNEIAQTKGELLKIREGNDNSIIDHKKEVALVSKAMNTFIDTKKVSMYQFYTQRLMLENGN